MSYKLYIGDTSADPLTFNSFRNIIGETHAGHVSLIGGKAEIRRIIDPSRYSIEAQQQWDKFTTNASRFYMLHFSRLIRPRRHKRNWTTRIYLLSFFSERMVQAILHKQIAKTIELLNTGMR